MNLKELALDPAEAFVLIVADIAIEKAAQPFLDLVVSGEWTNVEAVGFLDAVANVWDHPKGNDWEIAQCMKWYPVEVAQLLLAVAEWREAPVENWKLRDALIKCQITWSLASECRRDSRPVERLQDGTYRIYDFANQSLDAKQVADRLWSRCGPGWIAAGKPRFTAKQVQGARNELRNRITLVRKRWEPVFGVSEKVP